MKTAAGRETAYKRAAGVREYRQLLVWQRAHALALAVFEATGDFPAREQAGLALQVRTVSASVPALIARGAGRGGDGLREGLLDARGAASELASLLELTRDLRLVPPEQHAALHEQVCTVRAQLSRLLQRLHEGP